MKSLKYLYRVLHECGLPREVSDQILKGIGFCNQCVKFQNFRSEKSLKEVPQIYMCNGWCKILPLHCKTCFSCEVMNCWKNQYLLKVKKNEQYKEIAKKSFDPITWEDEKGKLHIF